MKTVFFALIITLIGQFSVAGDIQTINPFGTGPTFHIGTPVPKTQNPPILRMAKAEYVVLKKKFVKNPEGLFDVITTIECVSKADIPVFGKGNVYLEEATFTCDTTFLGKPQKIWTYTTMSEVDLDWPGSPRAVRKGSIQISALEPRPSGEPLPSMAFGFTVTDLENKETYLMSHTKNEFHCVGGDCNYEWQESFEALVKLID